MWGPEETRDLLKRFESSSFRFVDPIRLVRKALPDTLPIKVVEIIPRLKEGGAFVKFSYSPDVSLAEIESRFLPRFLPEPKKFG